MAPLSRLSFHELLDVLIDPGSWRGWDEPIAAPDGGGDPAYAADLVRARERTGLDEAVVTGEARIRGHRVAVAGCEFGFLAGSIGVAAGDRLCRAVERATAERIALLGLPASGGTRMQEGTPAFVQMIKVAGAIADHRASGLPYLVYLRHPTTGGAYASWGSLGQVTFAEPEALVAFLGPRVYESLTGERFPPGVQVAEHLMERGLVDAVVAPADLAGAVATALDVMSAPRHPAPAGARPHPDAGPERVTPVAESLVRSRRPDRPGVRQLLDAIARDRTVLRGTGAGETDPALVLALATIGPIACVVAGQDRAAPAIGPAGLRAARRGMRLAAELGLPLLTVIDTAGAALSVEAEEGGLAGEIARCVAELLTLPTPTLSLLLGPGTGGAALALLPADRTIVAAHGWLSPLPPEGAAVILYRGTDRTAAVAERQGIAAHDLRRAGIADRVLREDPDAADRPAAFLAAVGSAVAAELAELAGRPAATRLADRRRRYRELGRA